MDSEFKDVISNCVLKVHQLQKKIKKPLDKKGNGSLYKANLFFLKKILDNFPMIIPSSLRDWIIIHVITAECLGYR